MRLGTTIAATAGACIVAASAFTFGLGGSVSQTVAQDSFLTPRPISTGDYVPLDWKQKLQLGTAAYLRPEVFKGAKVAFAYDAVAIRENATPQVIEAVASGEVWFGLKSSDQPLLVSAPTVEQQHTLDDIVEGKDAEVKFAAWIKLETERAVASGKELMVVSTQPKLLGMDPHDEYLVWNPKKEIVFEYLGKKAGAFEDVTEPEPQPESQRK